MPGIVGLITDKPSACAKQELARMVEAIRHESFYTTGTWCDESLGVYVGWAARKNSFADGMPLSNASGDIVMAFSGEEYPEPGTARRLEGRGHASAAHGPSYLVHLYEKDPGFPVGLNGTFHGLVTDRTRGTATLFNDRYGMHRIYYHQSNGSFYFAAEAKAILAVCREARTPDVSGLAEFVACGCVMENRTLFKDVHVLPPAAAWVFRNRSVAAKGSYFEPREWEEQEPLEPDDYYRTLRDGFSQNLPRYFNGKDPIAVSLTGGLDTRVIMAWRKAQPGSLPCYTFGSMFRDNRDVRVARQVSEICEQPHSVIPVGDEFLSRFAHYAERSVYLTDGCVDLGRSSDLYVSERARAIAPTKIVGTYGSEVLQHATMFKPVKLPPGLFDQTFEPSLQQAEATYAKLGREHPVTFAAFRQSPWWHYGVLSLEQTQLTVRSPYLDNDFIRTVYRAPKSASPDNDLRLRLIADGSPRLGGIATDLGVGGSSGRVAAAASQLFQKFTFRAEYAYDSAMPQWLAAIDHLCSPFHFERLFLGRHKMSHYRIWYRDALSEYVRDMLLDARTLSRPYLKRSGVEEVVRGHLKGDRNYTGVIHKMLTLELIHRLFFDQR
jgi:asparagine synthase (glutamine-hydrolysing)